MRRKCRERFLRHRLKKKPLVNDPGMYHDTYVAHVPWCMSGLLTRGGEETFPAFPAHAQPTILCIWQEAHNLTQLYIPGAALHLHDGTMVELGWIVSNLTYHPLCYMCRLSDGSINLGYYEEPPATEGIIYVTLQSRARLICPPVNVFSILGSVTILDFRFSVHSLHMTVAASQITNHSTACPRSASLALCEGHILVTGGYRSQRVSNA